MGHSHKKTLTENNSFDSKKIIINIEINNKNKNNT